MQIWLQLQRKNNWNSSNVTVDFNKHLSLLYTAVIGCISALYTAVIGYISALYTAVIGYTSAVACW